MSREYQVDDVFMNETNDYEFQVDSVFINETQGAAPPTSVFVPKIIFID